MCVVMNQVTRFQILSSTIFTIITVVPAQTVPVGSEGRGGGGE